MRVGFQISRVFRTHGVSKLPDSSLLVVSSKVFWVFSCITNIKHAVGRNSKSNARSFFCCVVLFFCAPNFHYLLFSKFFLCYFLVSFSLSFFLLTRPVFPSHTFTHSFLRSSPMMHHKDHQYVRANMTHVKKQMTSPHEGNKMTSPHEGTK